MAGAVPPPDESPLEPTCAPPNITIIQAAPEARTTTLVPVNCADEVVRRVLDVKLAPPARQQELSQCPRTMSAYSALAMLAGAFALGFVLGLRSRRAAEDRARRERTERKRKTEWMKKTDNCVTVSTVEKEDVKTVWGE